MQPFNAVQNIPSRLKGIRIPSINRAKVSKFFYAYFLDLDEDELTAYLKVRESEKERK